MIEAQNLRKTYGDRVAVEDVSFSVREGGIFGFLGPNGAGKTTTVRMLIGLTGPTSGRATVAGFDPVTHPRDVHQSIGVVFENPNLYERLTVWDNLELFGRLHGVSRAQVRETVERLDLEARGREPISKFSKGMKQRVLIGRALLHKPRVLFLDEPTSGLDPSAAVLIRDMVRELQQQGATVFLTTHYMEEAEELCDRVAFIDAGRIAALDTPANLKLAHGQRALRVQLRPGEHGAAGQPERLEEIWPLDDPATGERLRGAISTGRILTVHSQEATLADVFIKLTGRSLR